jgi:hypothetical protein
MNIILLLSECANVKMPINGKFAEKWRLKVSDLISKMGLI